MGVMASQITSLTIVYSTIYSGVDERKQTSKLRVTDLCVGKSPVTGEFPAQMASNAENVSIWWRHHGWTWWRHTVNNLIIHDIVGIIVPADGRQHKTVNHWSASEVGRCRPPTKKNIARTISVIREMHCVRHSSKRFNIFLCWCRPNLIYDEQTCDAWQTYLSV